jgi:hypothetical protein
MSVPTIKVPFVNEAVGDEVIAERSVVHVPQRLEENPASEGAMVTTET